MTQFYDFNADTLTGQNIDFSQYKGQVVLVVNTASKCGFTYQYEGLQTLFDKYQDKGLVILGFPCNQFGQQEQGDSSEITEFCQLNYGVSFPMFAKIEVNGPNTHPLFNYLKTEQPGILGTKKIKWNFTKFLVNKEGQVVARFGSTTKPEKLQSEIEKLL